MIRDLCSGLPARATLRRMAMGTAMADALLSQSEFDQQFWFVRDWAPGCDAAGYDNGSGDEYRVFFTEAGAFLCGFAHESPMNPWGMADPCRCDGLGDAVPSSFAWIVRDPSLHSMDDDIPDMTFCAWNAGAADAWTCDELRYPPGDDPDGSVELVGYLTGAVPRLLADFFEDQCEAVVSSAAVRRLLDGEPLTHELVAGINPHADLRSLRDEIAVIGYPLAGSAS